MAAYTLPAMQLLHSTFKVVQSFMFTSQNSSEYVLVTLTWWSCHTTMVGFWDDSPAPKQDPNLAGIVYQPLGPRFVHQWQQLKGFIWPALWREKCFWRNNHLFHRFVSGELPSKNTLNNHEAWIWSHQFSGWSDSPCLQISTFWFPLSRSIYGGITPTMISPLLW